MKEDTRTYQSVSTVENTATTTAPGLRGAATLTKKNTVGTIIRPYVTIIQGHSGPT